MLKPKTAQWDYTKAMLPHTRKEVFIDVVKLHFKELLLCGVLVLFFSLPMHMLALAEDFYMSGIDGSLPENANAVQLMTNYKLVKAIVTIGLLLIFSIGFSGLMRVIRQYAWEENVFFFHDFFKGIRQNIRHTSLLALIVGILYASCVYYYNVAPKASGTVWYMFLLPSGLFVLLILPVSAYMTVCIPIYTNSFKQNIMMGLYLFGKCPIKTLMILAAAGSLFLTYFIPNIYVHLLGRLVCCFAVPFILLGWYLFVFDQCDKFVNPKTHPQLIGKGTFE